MPERQQLLGISVLVVEDSEDTREIVEQVLRGYGASVVTADSGTAALSIVEQSPPDVLLSDIGLPEMDGYTLLKKIRELEQRKTLAAIRAAAFTAFTSSDASKNNLAGFRFHISKTFDIDELAGRAANGADGDHA